MADFGKLRLCSEFQAKIALVCSFARIAHWWKSDELWSLIAERQQLVLPLQQFMPTCGIKYILSSSDVQM